jgi:hypothetical protein
MLGRSSSALPFQSADPASTVLDHGHGVDPTSENLCTFHAGCDRLAAAHSVIQET